ncbi:MAG: TetR/AcrR family transcriptional regulator, partial [Gammaproteobacteria bacterium]
MIDQRAAMARPAQFEREEILDKAMHAFWEQGYCATSMANLVEATSLKPGSIYAAFQSKQALFLEALDHYGNRSVDKLRLKLNEGASPLVAIADYFDQLALSIEDHGRDARCFLVNSVLELSPHDEQVRNRINQYFAQVEDTFVDALELAREQGEISRECDIRGLAGFLMNSIWGLRVLAGTEPAPGRA